MNKLNCVFCGEPVQPEYDYRKVTGWERKRDQGGTNALRLRVQHDAWAHASCVDREVRRVNARQQTLI